VHVTRPSTDAVVVGGGPIGLAAAIAMLQKGFTVLVADGAEPPIDKPCGEGMMPETLAALRSLGVALPPEDGRHFRGIRFVSGDTHVAADFPSGQGIGVRRTILHQRLLEAAERAGVRFLWKTPVRGIAQHEVQLPGHAIATRWIIGADGSGSRVRRWAGLDKAVRRQQRNATRRHYRVRPWNEYMEVHWGPRSQAYVTPISPEEVCIVVIAGSAEDANFETTLASLPELSERLAGAEIASRERGAITTMHTLHRVSSGNVALVGDSSGSVDAITGEGLRLGFRQAKTLADAIALGDLSPYEPAHRRLARRPVWMGQLMLHLGRNSWLRDRSMRALQRRPDLFERLLAIHVGHATPGHMLAAGTQLCWQFLAA
jgi:flavin-dependent dehydrogenase